MRTPLPLLAFAALAGAASAQNLLLPDNHHLYESATQQAAFSTTNWWGTTAAGRRFQVLYEASHFTGKAGVSGPVLLQHLRFRGEDGESNTGGQVYSNVTVNVCKTATAAAGMSTTFAANLPASLGGTSAVTTAIGSIVIPTLTVGASAGTVPNNWNIDIDLTAALPVIFDPATDPAGEVNLLVDIVWTGYTAGPAIPPATALIAVVPTQDTTAHGAGVRGAGRYATTPTAATGTSSTAPPVIGVEFLGGGGYPTLIPAKTEYIGASCGGSASGFYQLFTNCNRFDLANTGLTMTPDNPVAPNIYSVSAGAPPVDVTKVGVTPNTTDDSLVTFPLGYTFNYPGGSTTTIKPSTNGFIWLDSAMTATDYNPTLIEWLGNTATTPYTARVAPFWHDFVGTRNTASHPNCGLHVLNDTSGGVGNTVTYVTWLNTSSINCATGGGQSVCTMQCVFREATGQIEFRYGSFTEFSASTTTLSNITGIVGFTRGRIGTANSFDPRSRDLSHEALFGFTTGLELASSPHIFATSSPLAADPTYGARMFGGQSVTFGVSDVPAGTVLMLLNLDVLALQPGVQIPGITAPGCMINTGVPPLIFGWESAFFPGATWNGTLPLVIPHLAWDGVTITAQAMELDISGGPNLVKWASDTMKFTVGLD